MGLDRFLDAVDARRLSLVVLNRSAPRPVQSMLEETFAGQPVGVDERDLPDAEDDLVLLIEETDDGSVVRASSPLDSLMETILLVNSDLYRTGTSGLEDLALPEVIAGLEDVPFRLRGYPESNKEKLLLIVVSRYIERRAWQAGAGRLRSSFQRLSRINDERGTRAVYEKLADSPVQTHVYGMPDWVPPLELDLVTHGGYSDDHRDSWFVVYTPPEDGTVDLGIDVDEPHAALLAIEVSPRTWEGFWTFRPELVADIEAYITANL